MVLEHLQQGLWREAHLHGLGYQQLHDLNKVLVFMVPQGLQ